MAIHHPPIADDGEGRPIARLWADWFLLVWRAISGWKSSTTGTVTLDFSTVSANSQSLSAGFTVAGAALTDMVIVQPSAQTVGLLFTAHVSAADTVIIRAINFTAVGIDPPSTTFRVILLKQ